MTDYLLPKFDRSIPYKITEVFVALNSQLINPLLRCFLINAYQQTLYQFNQFDPPNKLSYRFNCLSFN